MNINFPFRLKRIQTKNQLLNPRVYLFTMLLLILIQTPLIHSENINEEIKEEFIQDNIDNQNENSEKTTLSPRETEKSQKKTKCINCDKNIHLYPPDTFDPFSR